MVFFFSVSLLTVAVALNPFRSCLRKSTVHVLEIALYCTLTIQFLPFYVSPLLLILNQSILEQFISRFFHLRCLVLLNLKIN